MESIKFLIFEKKGKYQASRYLLFITFFTVGFAFLLLGSQDFFAIKAIESIGLIIVGCTGIVYFVFGFYSLSEKEKLNGSFTGYLIFSKSIISVGDKVYHLNDVLKIEFFVGDYDGLIDGYLGFSPIPKISNGVGNSIRLKMYNGTEEKFNFQLNYENEFQKKMSDLLISYHLQDKISFQTLIQYIGISDSYEQIQEFKKELEELYRK